METIFFFNKGRYAKVEGLPRVAPETVEYPTFDYVTKKQIGAETVKLEGEWLALWFRGYDAIFDKYGRYKWR